VRASHLLRVRTLWIAPVLMACTLLFLMALIYVGSVVDPTSHLHGLPVLLVNEDEGASAPSGQKLHVGQEVVSALKNSPAITGPLSMSATTTLAHAEAQMNKGADYATLVIPPGFSRSLLGVYGAGGSSAPASIPTVQLLTNARAGTIGVSLASSFLGTAIARISRKLAAHFSSSGEQEGGALGAVRADPLAFSAVPYRPLPPHSALGLSAFYISLLTIMCGFLCGTIVNTSVDAALGFAAQEVGPKWAQRAPVPISRWQTLLAKWLMALVIAPVLVAVMLVVAVGILHMDASDVGYLWLFAAFAAVVIAIGTLVLFAALGSLGQLVAMLVFVYLALASSGGTIPIQALPGVLKLAADFEPLRQVLGGVRAILYFNAADDAGLGHGVVMTALGLMIWVLAGAFVTNWYDRKGFYRMRPEVMAHVNRSIRDFAERDWESSTPTGEGDGGEVS
jgi:YhgE/Pip-like protein